MYQKVLIACGVIGVCISIFIGVIYVLDWTIISVFVAISIGIPSLILMYKKDESEKSSKNHEVPSSITGFKTLKKFDYSKNGKKNSSLLSEGEKITDLKITNELLDQIYEKARRKAIKNFPDVKLIRFTILVFPYQSTKVNIYLEFISEYAKKIIKYRYNDSELQVLHSSPNKRLKKDTDKIAFKNLPWKTYPHWIEFPKKIEAIISPLVKNLQTHYYLSISAYEKEYPWYFRFDDGFTGETHIYHWTGRELNEKNLKELKTDF